MSVMTIKIGPEKNGRVVFETVSSLPHKPKKYIAGFSRNKDDAKKRAIAYAGDDVAFIFYGESDVMHNVEAVRRKRSAA